MTEVPAPKFDSAPPSPRLKGSLVTKLAAQRAADAEADARSEQRSYGGMTVDLSPDSKIRQFETGAVGITDATVTGLRHLSVRQIERFTNDGGSDRASKYGPGTYVASGELGGTQLGLLQKALHFRYELTVHGNVLAVPHFEQDDVAYELAHVALGNEDVSIADSPHLLNRVLREHPIDGVKYDAFFIYTTPEEGREMAEGVILYPETVLEVTRREHVESGGE